MSTAEDLPQPHGDPNTGMGHNSSCAIKRPLPRLKRRAPVEEKPITEEELLRACETVSLIIEAYGDVYWPILDRLEMELEKLQSRRKRISKYTRNGAPLKHRR